MGVVIVGVHFSGKLVVLVLVRLHCRSSASEEHPTCLAALRDSAEHTAALSEPISLSQQHGSHRAATDRSTPSGFHLSTSSKPE